MKKRVWSLFLALALCLAMMPQTALAEAGGENAAGGEQGNVHAVAAQTADNGNTNGAGTAGGENSTGSEECQHTKATLNQSDNNYYCEKCNKQMFVKVEAAGSTATYGTDLAAAMTAAADGTTITLLADINNESKNLRLTGKNKTVTLNLHGCTINGGNIKVGIDQDGSTHTSSTLKIVGSGSFTMEGEISVGGSATLDLSGWGGGENDTIDYVSLHKRGTNSDPGSTLLVEENMKGTIKI